MDNYYGFDLGDAESAIAHLQKGSTAQPEMLKIQDVKSFITAYARLIDQGLIIGENACYHPDATERKVRFKSRFLTDPESAKDVRCFASGVLTEIERNGTYNRNSDSGFYIGCPAGWDKNVREHYRQIFQSAGYPPLKIISESRAAMVSACQSKHLQVGYDILSHPVLVVDVGSSTTDFAYIRSGKEVELKTGGEVFLGGGIMDELLLESAVDASGKNRQIQDIFAKSPAWKSYCEFAARRLKEKYFSDEDYWSTHECISAVQIAYEKRIRLTMSINAAVADRLLNKKAKQLNGKSFHQVFTDSLKEIRASITEELPDLLFLTGGVSKMPALADWCREVFPESVVITSSEPEFSVARGLAWCGKIDDELREFKKEIEELRDSTIVEQIVSSHIKDLYREAAESLTEPILKNTVLPVIDRWREGTIEKLEDIDKELQEEITAWLHSEEAKELLVKPITTWLKPVAYDLEEHTVPICLKYNVPHRALSLSSYLSLSEIDLQLDAKDVFAVEEITWLIDAIVSILVGLLCGGSGIALIASGLPGIIAGIVISLIVLFVGKNPMQSALMKINLPVAIRKLVPKKYFETRIQRISSEVKAKFLDSLEKDKGMEISERLVNEISAQIEDCLIKMAEVVEIPLG